MVSYRWIDKDPAIDLFRAALKETGAKLADVAKESGVSVRTLHAWDFGSTRKPQRLTFRFAMAAMGYREVWQRDGKDGARVEVVYDKGKSFGRIVTHH